MTKEQQIKTMEEIGSKIPCDRKDCSKCLAINRRCNDFLFAERLYDAGYRKADELIAEIEQLRTRHAALDRQIRADARREFAEKLKNYYFNTLKGSTNSTLVAYHIDQILEDIERKEEQ